MQAVNSARQTEKSDDAIWSDEFLPVTDLDAVEVQVACSRRKKEVRAVADLD